MNGRRARLLRRAAVADPLTDEQRQRLRVLRESKERTLREIKHVFDREHADLVARHRAARVHVVGLYEEQRASLRGNAS